MSHQASGPESHKVIIADSEEDEVSVEPIVIDMGKKKKKDVRKLRRGKPGKLMRRLEDTLSHLRENGALAKDAQPVVIVLRKKAKRKGKRLGKMWGLG